MPKLRPTAGSPGMLILICGLPGAGKTTLARRLEVERPAVRFTEDEWVARLFGPDAAHDGPLRDRIHEVQWGHAVRVAQLGVDVVLDWGFWARGQRDDYRGRAAALGLTTELHYLDVSRDDLWRRIALRNRGLPPDSFHVHEHELDEWVTWFEPPTADELS